MVKSGSNDINEILVRPKAKPIPVLAVMVMCVILLGVGVSRGQGCMEVESAGLSWWSGNDAALDIAGMNRGTLMNGAASNRFSRLNCLYHFYH